MCYHVFLSTTDAADLSAWDSPLLRLERESAGVQIPVRLLHPFRWRVFGRDGCGCGFRHVMDPEQGFGVPEEWCPEDPEDVRATAELFERLRALLDAGAEVDCAALWEGAALADVRQREVRGRHLRPGEFRFFENHHIVLRGD